MFEYNLTTWLLLFFIYSFLGWIWESSYVSIKDKKWTNRGFMSGPFLPIYGSGAIIVLFTTLPVRDSKVGIYFVGAISATLLELVVGYVTEKVFKVRYWDYSYKKIQYKGYICLTSSIAWGFFSILLVDYLNLPIQNYLAQFDMETLNHAVILILIPFVADITLSTHAALDLKKLLETMEENSKVVSKLMEQLDGMQVKLDENTEELKSFMERVKTTVIDEKEYRKILSSIHEKITNNIQSIDKEIQEDMSENSLTEMERAYREEALNEYKELDNKIDTDEFSIKQINFKDFKSSIKLLKRNPTANHKSLKGEMTKLANTSFEDDDTNLKNDDTSLKNKK